MRTDFVIIGGGIAGAAAAYFLSTTGSVALLEQEAHFGTHSSGRSAGQYTVGITADRMRGLAAASRAFLSAPPAGFTDGPLITPRGSLTVGNRDQRPALDRLHGRIVEADGTAEWLDRDGVLAQFPALRPDGIDIGVLEADAQDIDVDRLLQAYLRGARRNGATLATTAGVQAIRREAGAWSVETPEQRWQATVLINAAGGWVDMVAAMAGIAPVGIVPYKRTAFTFPLLPDRVGATWPHVCNTDYKWYVKPEHGCFMGSPADAVPVAPGEVYADDIDVATAIHAIEHDTSLRIGRPISSWAGMRSYVRDREPVCGGRADSPDFIWMAGQGGCGVLTSPALGQAVAALASGRPLPDALTDRGVTAAGLSPDRPGIGPA